MQYTIRNIPKQLDRAVRAKAKSEKKSLNQAVVDALKAGLGVTDNTMKRRDLSDVVGSLTPEDAKAIEDAVAEMDKWDLEFQREDER